MGSQDDRRLLEEAGEALVWASGAKDFAPEGVAREGFEKLVAPVIDRIVQRTRVLPLTSIKFVAHEDDEWYDEISITTVERWKESELSGDEWRFNFYVQFKRKGHTLIGRTYSRLPWLLAYLPSVALNDYPGGADKDHQVSPVIEHRYEFCFQPGCAEPATAEFRAVRVYDKRGDEQDKLPGVDYRMRYCDRHARSRGDCGLMDSDSNLVAVAFGSPADAPALGQEA